jgi:hypothetical protein
MAAIAIPLPEDIEAVRNGVSSRTRAGCTARVAVSVLSR